MNTHVNENIITEVIECSAEFTGTVECLYRQTHFFSFYCRPYLKEWPFDTQKCQLDIGVYYSKNTSEVC